MFSAGLGSHALPCSASEMQARVTTGPQEVKLSNFVTQLERVEKEGLPGVVPFTVDVSVWLTKILDNIYGCMKG